ncbi:MAG: hypothetical protein [Bacteriophage sp.]|nr:MAG: hypothetical protein [Bacteriophage sp.]
MLIVIVANTPHITVIGVYSIDTWRCIPLSAGNATWILSSSVRVSTQVQRERPSARSGCGSSTGTGAKGAIDVKGPPRLSIIFLGREVFGCTLYRTLQDTWDTMAWHSIKQAQELTGKARSTLYRDMNAGRLSYRTESDSRRSIETTELIRVYGEVRRGATPAQDSHGQGDETQKVMSELVQEMRALREEVAGLKAELQEVRRLEHKQEAPPTAQVPVKLTWWQKFWE